MHPYQPIRSDGPEYRIEQYIVTPLELGIPSADVHAEGGNGWAVEKSVVLWPIAC